MIIKSKLSPFVKVTDFFANEYVDYSSYDNLRKIASIIDGQKNASRKVLWTLIKKNIKSEVKVSQLSSNIEQYTEYLHGSIAGVLTNMGKDYAGTNNLPLVQKSGNFGTRFIKDPSATRYIYASGSKNLFNYFDKNDTKNLIHQSFEGDDIEPRFLIPTLPILLINGSEGAISSGFSQEILPRNPDEIKKIVLNKLDGGKRRAKMTPYYNGFKGVIIQGETHKQWLIKGCIARLSPNRVQISEIPTGNTLKGYTKFLDKLEDDKFISSYTDKSEDDKFLFEVKIPSKVLGKMTDDEVLSKLKLIKTVSENYTCINHLNKIQVFENVEEMVDAFIDVKNKFMEFRKDSLIQEYNEDFRIAESKYKFIKMVTEDKIVINKRKKDDIIKELYSIGDKFFEIDGKLDYLLAMKITSLTKENMKELKESAKIAKQNLAELKSKTPQDLLIEDINSI